MRQDLIYGIHVIEQLLTAKPQQFLEIFLLESRGDKKIQEIVSKARAFRIAIHKISKSELDNWLPQINHQGVAARIRPQPVLNGSDLMELLQQEPMKKPLLLILDSIQDPHNLGACLRTADATNVTAVVIPKDKGVSVTPAVRKVASGAAETIPVVQVTNLVRCLEQLKKEGIWIVGSSFNAKQSLYQVDFRGPIAIVLGAEGNGLRRLTEEHCDILMRIPMYGAVESLNVSVATGICLYEALRQRM